MKLLLFIFPILSFILTLNKYLYFLNIIFIITQKMSTHSQMCTHLHYKPITIIRNETALFIVCIVMVTAKFLPVL